MFDVLLLNQHLPPDPAPTGRLAADLLRGLAEAGIEAAGLAGPPTYGEAPREARGSAPETRVLRVRGTRFGRVTLAGKALDAATFAAGVLARARGAIRPGGVVVSLSSPPLLPALADAVARRRRARLVLWCQDLWPEVGTALGLWREGSARERVLRRAVRGALARAARVVALSARMRDRLVASGVAAARVAVVPNWVGGAAGSCAPGQVARARRELGA
ncbi:MAG: glycosyltransferase, partial [Planctomycetales bacterium]|nr:glycosyltransferase [Planctomycetales bacterium]